MILFEVVKWVYVGGFVDFEFLFGKLNWKLVGWCLLVVEDNEINWMLIERIFSCDGVEVVFVVNGCVVVEILKVFGVYFDVVLMDI